MLDAGEIRFSSSTDPTSFQKLCGVKDLEAFLASDSARTPRVGLADSRREGNAGISYDDYTKGEDGRIDLPRLFALHDAGATLILSHMHEIHPPLGRFCRGLERIFLHPVQGNIYLTPPGAQGFRAHYDTHDVLILQVQGEKLWRLWPTPCVPFANTHTLSENQPILDEEPLSQMMRPGDVLYVPRGVLHDASSQGAQSSLHLTIGILGQSWGDALRAALDIMEPEDPALRQLFPMWRLVEGSISDDFMREAATRLSALGTMKVVELISQHLLRKLAAEQMPMLTRGLIAPTVSASDRLYLSDTVHHFVLQRPDGSAELHWAGGRILLSAEELSWMTRLDEGVSTRELGGAEALTFCQRLASAGLVLVEPSAAVKAAE
jgi:ribosomal protein L16 Arg81 hydroxylase